MNTCAQFGYLVNATSTLPTDDENYEVDKATFDAYVADPTRAHDFIAKAKARELDHLLLLKPGTDRGFPD